MNFWWVAHNTTHTAERALGYIWCPSTDGRIQRQGYLNLTRVRAGDVIFSYAKQVVGMVGIATGRYSQEPRPAGGGYQANGDAWGEVGWKVPIAWNAVPSPIAPKQHLEELSKFCIKNGPLTDQGNGKESVYLAEVPFEMGQLLLQIARSPVQIDAASQPTAAAETLEIEESQLPPTTKQQLIDARYGQGTFRKRLWDIEKGCRVTGMSDRSMLIASHILPWRSGTDFQRLDGQNGLLLAPHVDRLFDRGHITFGEDGTIHVASPAARAAMKAWNIDLNHNVGSFNAEQLFYLEHHRKNIFSNPEAALDRGDEK